MNCEIFEELLLKAKSHLTAIHHLQPDQNSTFNETQYDQLIETIRELILPPTNLEIFTQQNKEKDNS